MASKQFTDDEPNLTEVELMTIADKVIGENWEHVAPLLDINRIEISQIKADESKMINQIFSMLLKWSQNLGSGATFTRLKSVLEKAPDSALIDWKKFNALVENRQPSNRPSEMAFELAGELNGNNISETSNTHSPPEATPVPVQPYSDPNNGGNDHTDGAIYDQISKIFDRNSDGKGRLNILDNEDVKVLNKVPKDKIGEGGFGVVYKFLVKDKVQKLDIEMVLKVITVKKEDNVKKMGSVTNEKLASRTMHFGIVPLLAYGADDYQAPIERSFYFVAPYLENGNLANAIQHDNENPPVLILNRRLKILYQISSAIDFLHTHVDNFRGTILHMDIKTSNIVLDACYNARLIDFGLAREMEEGLNHVQTTSLPIPYTKGYFEIIPHDQLNVFTDYYNFGVVILELLTGKMPYDKEQRPKFEELGKQKKTYLRRRFMEIWKDKKEQLFPVADDLLNLSEQCRNSVKQKNITSSTLLRTIKSMLSSKDKWESVDGWKKCDLCMQYVAVDVFVLGHNKECRMKVCVSCMRYSFCNPIICHTCGEKITPNIGHGWRSILIAGNDLKDGGLAKLFSKDVDEVKKVITSKSPLVMGISEHRVVTIKPHSPGTSDTMREKLIDTLKKCMSTDPPEEEKTLLLYFSGHYDEESKRFLLGNNDDYISVEEFENHLLSNKVRVRFIVFLDCCSCPSFLDMKLQYSKNKIILVQLNACRRNGTTYGDEKIDGSIFQRLFTQALTGKALSTKCTSITQSNQECEKCQIDDEFVTIYNLQKFIHKHYMLYNHGSEPPLCLHDAGTNDQRIGYVINFCVDLKLHFEWKDYGVEQEISPHMFCDIKELRTELFNKFCNFVESKQASRNPTRPGLDAKDFSDILFIHTKNGPKLKHRVHLDTIEKLNMAWESKRELYVSLRDTSAVKEDDDLLGVFFDESVEPVLDFLFKQGSKISDTQNEYSVEFDDLLDFTQRSSLKQVEDIVCELHSVGPLTEEQGESVSLRVRIAYDENANPKYRTDFLCFRLQVDTARQ